MKIKGIKKLTALFLCLTLAATVLCGVPFGAVSAATANTAVSSVVTKNGRTYIEHNGEPYLMYGIQMRLDWQYADKMTNEAPDWDWIEENFKKAVEDGFKSVAIPVYWSFIETGNHGIRSTEYLEKMYEYIYKYDLTVQWLWFGTNVCGLGSGTMPWYICKTDSEYTDVFLKDVTWSKDDNDNWVSTPTEADSPYVNFSNEAVMKKEQDALAYMMQYIAERDTEKRCVMLQINNEIDQGGNYWLPKENGSYAEDWWTNEDGHNKYCYAFGQREKLFAQLDALGEVVHNSAYNCVTRVNLSEAARPNYAQADYDDLLALDGIDIVGIDCYSTDLETINSKLSTESTGNFTHLAESASTYDSSTNTAKLMESGVGNLIFCHRTDRTNGGLYVSDYTETTTETKTETIKVFNRQYKEWKERENTAAVRAWNKSINKAYDKLAAAVANNELAVFTANAEAKSIGTTKFTFNDSGDGDKLALALKVNATEYVLISVKSDCELALSNASILSAEVGEYADNGAWVKSGNAVVNNGSVTVKAGEAVLVKTAEANIAGEVLTATGDTLSNGAVVYKANENGGTVVLADSAKDFTLSFKYRDVQKDVSNPAPLNVKLRGGKYTLAIHEWATAGQKKSTTLRFLGNGNAVGGNNYFEVNDDVWTEFKIVMAGQRVAIFKNGVLWNAADLKAEAAYGALTLELSGAYDTYIADVKLTSAEEKDTYGLIDADLQSNEVYGNKSFCGMPLTYANGDTKIAAGTYSSYDLYNNPGEYEFSVDFYYDSEYYLGDGTKERIQGMRGLQINAPSGNTYLFVSNALYLKDNKWAANTSLDLSTSDEYHTAMLVYKNNKEYVYLDGQQIYSQSVEASSGELGLYLKLAAADRNETAYLKNIKLVNTENISRTTVTEFPELNESFDYNNKKSIFGYSWSNTQWEAFSKDEISGAQLISETNGNTPMFDETANSDITLGFKLYMPTPEQESTDYVTNVEAYLRRPTDVNTYGIRLVFQNKRVYVNYYSITEQKEIFKEASYSNTDYFASTPIGRWAEVEIYMFGTSFMLAMDGKVIFCTDDVVYDFTAARTSRLWTQAAVCNIAIADVKLQSLDGLMNAIESINNVTYDTYGIADEALRQTAITSFTRLYSKVERQYLQDNTSWYSVYYDHGDVNIDGSVNILDLVRLKKITASPEKVGETAKSDINRDGSYDGKDLVILRKVLLGIL